MNLHVSPENSRRNGLPKLQLQTTNKSIKPWLRNISARCSAPRWTITLPDRRKQGELTHRQNLATNIPYAAIHHTGFIVKHPQPGQFGRQPFDIALAIRCFDPDQDQQPSSDCTGNDARHLDASRQDSLYHNPHQSFPLLINTTNSTPQRAVSQTVSEILISNT